ncbi:MAG: 23S rRNA (adenine(2030)-N(6))-methyltransferase RlmJ [Caulobacteraceae bacterium]|nr:23S rRNA (adenine(2030)-N(6))-methyltransferase RlmJ [Caulobacteraceae bacterium]
MNYRHAFHAGNFADIVKHAALTHLLADLVRRPGPASIVDTHAGAGLYDLQGAEAQKAREAEKGVLKLMGDPDLPPALAPLAQAVRAANDGGATRLYPGSPWLISRALRSGDRYTAWELRPDICADLRRVLGKQGRAVEGDGFAGAPRELAAKGPALALIDAPFEQGEDYPRTARAMQAILRRNPAATVMAWLPLKDLDTFDRFLGDLEDTPVLVAEARLRPLTDPMKMNGCALAIAGASDGLETQLEAICAWVLEAAGEAGARSRIWRP